MSFANEGLATSTSGRPPVGSTVDSKSAHPQARVIAVNSAATSTRISACAGGVVRDSARIARLRMQVDAGENTGGEKATRCVEELAGEACRAPRVHRAAKESVRARRAQLQNRMIGVARAVEALDADIEDRLLAEHANPHVRKKWKTRYRARREHLQREVLRLEVIIAVAAVADLRVVHRFALGAANQIFEAGDRSAHLPPCGDESWRDRDPPRLERARYGDREKIRFDVEDAHRRHPAHLRVECAREHERHARTR